MLRKGVGRREFHGKVGAKVLLNIVDCRHRSKFRVQRRSVNDERRMVQIRKAIWKEVRKILDGIPSNRAGIRIDACCQVVVVVWIWFSEPNGPEEKQQVDPVTSKHVDYVSIVVGFLSCPYHHLLVDDDDDNKPTILARV